MGEFPDLPDIPGITGVTRELHHIAIVVEDMSAARGFYETTLGLVAHGDVEHVPGEKVNVLVLMSGTQRVELVEPASEDSPVMPFLRKRGPGVHHMAYRVDDMEEAIRTLKERGVRMIHDAGRPGSHGTSIAFLHPKSTGGVLVEIVEDPKAS
jgi:methylmalonyl-CoA epimerase